MDFAEMNLLFLKNCGRLASNSCAVRDAHLMIELRCFVTASGAVAASVAVAKLVVGTVGGLVLAAPEISVTGDFFTGEESLIDI